MRQKLTVLIPCKDEEKNIRACLESVTSIADEILVADSGSTDGCLRIVDEMSSTLSNVRTIQREYINPSSFKNWAIPQASHPWVLALDADERVTDGLADEIRQLLSHEPPCDAYFIHRLNYFFGNPVHHSGWQNDAPMRLFRRDGSKYDDRQVHEHLVVASNRIGRLRGSLLHYTFWSFDQVFDKNLRYAAWAAQDLHRNGRRSNIINIAVRPWIRFCRHYFLKQGFRDGMAGLLLSCLAAFTVFTKYAYLWEIETAELKQGEETRSGFREMGETSHELNTDTVVSKVA